MSGHTRVVFTRGVSLSLDEDGGPEPATAWVGLEDTVLREQARHRRTDAYESTPMGTWRGQVHRDGEAAAGCRAGAGETAHECFLGTEFQSGKMMVVTATQVCVG